MKKILSPDAPTTTGSGSSTITGSPVSHVRTPTLPRGDDDVRDTAQLVSAKWSTTPAITLIWITPGQFGTLVTNFATELGTRKSVGGSRSPLTDDFDMMNERIDDAIPYVKGYIAGKYGANHAPAHYAPFGIVHVGYSWEFPNDHNQRKAALDLMVAAIAAEGFGANEYGTTFWTQARTDFNALLGQTTTTDESISTEVSAKSQLKTQIKRVLQALIYVLHGNYPDTYYATLRAWGIIKQDF
jgi:hypothetical protein